MAETSGPSSAKDKKTPEQTVAAYNALRLEQRQIATKVYELESDLNEHRLVIDALNKVEPDRKCYRLIGGILTESKVQTVLPNLENNSEQIKRMIENLNQQLIAKGKEVLEGSAGPHPQSS